MCSIVILCRAQSQVDVDKLFHANPPSLSPNRPANAQRPQSIQNADPSSSAISGIFDEDFKPFRGSRHDEFDWALTKVLISFTKILLNEVLKKSCAHNKIF